MWRRTLALVNARVLAGSRLLPSIRFRGTVLELGGEPKKGDAVVDAGGAFVLPGLVNAHDHLELNHFGRLKFRPVYENASDWIDDMKPRLHEDPDIVEARARPLSDRLLAGGLKNLLSGVTTVAHHNPLYRPLRRGFPVRIVRRYGWAHSFALQGQPVGAGGELGADVERACRRTASSAPFLVHLAEGVDARARGELSRLEAIGCLGGNTVIVHGVAITAEEFRRVRRRGAGLVWCPSSNGFLLGRTARVRAFLDQEEEAPICLGTDARLSGERDLLDELRAARARTPVSPSELLRMVTSAPARLLRLPAAGRLAPGLPADLILVPPLADRPAERPEDALLRASRGDLSLVAVGGRPLVARPELAEAFAARGLAVRPGRLDGGPRLFEEALARRIGSSSVQEPGVELEARRERCQETAT